jgi:hypothetical protein
MSFTGAFTLTRDSATGLNFFTLNDTSSYIDEPKDAFTDRYFYLVKTDGTYVQDEDGNDEWDFNFDDYPSDEINVQVLTEDIALSVYMVWVPITPNSGSTYTLTTPFDFTDYACQWKYNMVLHMAANRDLVANQNFREGIFIFEALLKSSGVAIENYDPYASQKCIEQMVYIQDNPNILQ